MKTEDAIPSDQTRSLSYLGLTPRNFPAACRAKLKALKSDLVRRFTTEFSDLQARLVRRAVDEAEALAALTDLPLLLFPSLAEEKVQKTREWNLHQREILHRSGLALAD